MNEKSLVVFPSGHLHIKGLSGCAACIFIRGGQEREGKKSFVRDPAGCLKLLFGDLNFSCFPMSLVCPCGTQHTVQYVSLSELKQKVSTTQTVITVMCYL